MLNERKGKQHNLVTAYAWYALAASRGDKVAGEHLSGLREKLTKDDVSAAAVLAAKFKTMIDQE